LLVEIGNVQVSACVASLIPEALLNAQGEKEF
jgi:hypothetical protein